MPTSEELLTLQDAIDKVVNTSQELQQSNQLLIENISLVSTHNASPEAHPDIREDIQNIPSAISSPSLTGPLTVENGESYDFTFSATPLLVGSSVIKFRIVKEDLSVIILSGDQVTNNQATTSMIFVGERFTKQRITVFAYDNYDNASPSSTIEFTITKDAPPDATNLICNNLPLFINPGESVPVSFSGATDIDIPFGDTLTYSLSSVDLTFSKNVGITDNEVVTISVPSDALRGSVKSFNVTVHDSKTGSATKNFTLAINQLPDMTSFVHTLPSLINKDSSVQFRVSGATDPDGQNITYSIINTDPHLSFSKTDNIPALELITLTVDDTILNGSTISFKVVATDEYHGSKETIINNAKINTPPDISGLISSLPSIVKPGGNYTFHFSGASDIDDPNIKYSFSCSDLSFNFSKTSDISTNDDITTVIPTNALRGSSFTLTVTATDNIGATSFKIFTYSINKLIDVSNAQLNIPTFIKPNTTYPIKVTGVTDTDTQTISYAIESDTTDVTFSNTSGISIGQDINLIASSTITRGNTVTLTCTFTDGLEIVTKTFTTKVNRLPSSSIVDTIPSIVKPNSSVPISLTSSDLDGQAVTYSVSTNDAHVTVSKASNIAPGESFNLVTSLDASRGQNVDIIIIASDGLESITKTKTIMINTLPSTVVSHNIPDVVIPNSSNSITLNSTDSDGQTLMYSISCDDPDITFSKTSGISVNESFSMFISSDITRGATPTLTITISDGLESVVVTHVVIVNVLPNMTGCNINSLPTICKPNGTYALSLSGAVDSNGENLTYSISSNNNKVTFDTASNLEDNQIFNMTVDTSITRGATVTFTITASNGLESSTKTFTTFVNTLPDMSSVAFNTSLPTVLKPNTTYSGVTLSGMTDVSATQTLTYAISCNNGQVTLSKYSGIAQNETFDVVVGNVIRGEDITFTIIGNDGLENSFSITRSRNVNTLPVVSGVTCSIPSIVKPGGAYDFVLAGATDTYTTIPSLLYSISSDDAKLTFSKSSNITANETVTLTVDPTTQRGKTVNFTVTVFDGLESSTKTFGTKINTLPSTSLVHNVPALVIPGNNYSVNLSDTDVDAQTLLYSISSNNAGITFSKSSNISNNETFTMMVASNIERSVSITLTVTISDGIESISKTITTEANTLPDTTTVTINSLPSIVKPGSSYSVNISGGNDTNGQGLTYGISSNNGHVTFSKSSGLTSGEAFTITVDNTVTRGDTISFTVSVSDGMETTTKTGFNSVVNTLPVMTSVAFSLPARVKPSSTSTGITLTGITDLQAQSLSYAISCDNASVSFSKSSGISNNEGFDITFDNISRNTLLTFTVTGSDGMETSTKTFTSTINSLPVTTNVVVNSLPAIVKPNTTYPINISGATDVDSQTLSYSISSDNGNVTFSKSSGLSSGESFNMTVGSSITRGTTVNLTVTVSDGLETATKTGISFVANTLPDMTGVTFSIPAIIKPSATQSGVAISGGTDTNGQTLTYSISCDNGGITFSKSSGLASGETFNVIAGAITRNTTLTFTVTASDGLETNTKTFTSKVNQLPSTSVTTSLPAILKPNSTNAITLSSTDPDGQTVSYAISSSDANVTFSKSSGIAANESFNVIVGASTTRASTVTLTITISDGLETSSTTKTFKVNSLPVVTGVTTTLPTITKPNSTVAFSMSGATDVDSQTLTYAISSDNVKVTFSKTSGITSGESVNIITATDVVRGTTVTLTITVSDGMETASTTKTLKINTLPSTSLTETLPAIIVPGQTYATTLSSTDSDSGQTLSYAITSSDNANITYSKSSNLAANESFNIIVGSGASRGSTITFTVTISDGLETSTATFTAVVNSLPTGTFSDSAPAYITPGSVTPNSFSGITDPNGGTITYSIVNNEPKLSFSKTSAIASGESINMTTTSDITRGSTPNVTIVASDGLESTSYPLGIIINTLPVMSGVVFSLPAIVKPSTSYANMTLSGMTDTTILTSLTYSISCDNGSVTFSKSTGLAANETFTVTIGAIARNTTLTFTITGSDGLETATTTKTAKINNLPVMTSLADTLPAILKPNSTNVMALSGATDPDGQGLSYSITSDKAYVTFSKSTGLASGESFNVILSSAAVRGETITFTVTTSDGLETSTNTFTAKVNTLPSTSLTDSLPAVVVPGQTYATTMSSTDSDGQTLSYSISSSDTNVTFSKSSGLSSGESFNIVVGSSTTRGSTVTFTVTISDGLETSSTTFTTTVNVLPVVTSLVANNLPAIVKPSGSYTTLNFSGATTGGDSGQTITYAVSANDGNVTFSKASGIASGENITMSVGASITRNTTVTLTVTASDGLESVQKTFTTLVNSLPVVASLSLPNSAESYTDGTYALLIPGKTYSNCSISNVTDVNSGSQTISLSISSSDNNVTFSKSSGLAVNETFTMTVGSSITRNTVVTLTITASDGLETASTTRPRKVNNLPVVTNLVCNNLPASVNGSATPISVNFSGATDADNNTLSYTISNIDTGLTFSKTSAIASGESINLTIAKVSTQTVKAFTVTVSDGMETVTKNFSVTVNPIYVIATPTVTSPTEGQVMPTDAFTFTFDAINVTVDMS